MTFLSRPAARESDLGMMTADWLSRIAQVAHWKQLAAEADRRGVLPWYEPRVAASDAEIAESERHVGPLPADYRGFLGHANGWQGFYLSTDLFGTPELVSGQSEETLARQDVRQCLRDAGVHLKDAIAVGRARVDTDVFIAVSPRSEVLPSAILWFSGTEIERRATFADFFDAMIGYNAYIAQMAIKKTQN